MGLRTNKHKIAMSRISLSQIGHNSWQGQSHPIKRILQIPREFQAPKKVFENKILLELFPQTADDLKVGKQKIFRLNFLEYQHCHLKERRCVTAAKR